MHTIEQSGSVDYHKTKQRLPCRVLLHTLRLRTSRAYGVINLEETHGTERCLAPLRGLGEAIGHLHAAAARRPSRALVTSCQRGVSHDGGVASTRRVTTCTWRSHEGSLRILTHRTVCVYTLHTT